jgi:lactoylglutathione lyase
MEFKLAHTNINVRDLETSLAFYKDALGLQPVRTYEQPDGE